MSESVLKPDKPKIMTPGDYKTVRDIVLRFRQRAEAKAAKAGMHGELMTCEIERNEVELADQALVALSRAQVMG